MDDELEVELEDDEDDGATEVVYEVVEDDGVEDEFDEEDESANLATEAAEESLKQKGKDDRAFYDSIAKDADTQRHALEKDIATSSLYLNDAKAKLGKKERELKEVLQKIADAKERETSLGQKAYRTKAITEEDAELRGERNETSDTEDHLGILGDRPLSETEKRELGESLADTERRTQMTASDIKELLPMKERLEAEIKAMKDAINERERKLSLERHNLARMT